MTVEQFTGKTTLRGSVIRFRWRDGFRRVFVESHPHTRVACEVTENYTPFGGARIYSGDAASADAQTIAADFLTHVDPVQSR